MAPARENAQVSPSQSSPSRVRVPERGFSAGLSVDERFEFLAGLEDTIPEGVSEEELEEVSKLRASLLEAEGLASPPKDWIGGYFYISTLVRYLRARGSQEVALASLQNSIRWARTTCTDMLRKHEQEDHPVHKALLNKYVPEGHFGVDKHGLPVHYIRLGLRDTAGLIRETSLEVVQRYFVDKLMRDTFHAAVTRIKEGCLELEAVFVLDLDGMTWSRGAASMELIMWLSSNVLQDHFPNITKVSFIVNAPWYFNMGWTLLQPFIPAKTKVKFRIFGCGADFMEELQEFVAPEQIPAFLGGKSSKPWPYGEGGDVPLGAGRLEASSSSPPPDASGARPRKPSWMKVLKSSAAASIRQRTPSWHGNATLPTIVSASDIRTDDRSLGQEAARQAEGEHQPQGPPGPARRRQASRSEGASWLELVLLAFAAFGLHALLRCSQVLSAQASLSALVGASAAWQYLRLRRRQRPAAPPVSVLHGKAGRAGGHFLAPAAGAGRLAPDQQLPASGGEAEESEPYCSWCSPCLGMLSDKGTEPAPVGDVGASPDHSGSWRQLADVFCELGNIHGGLRSAWPACVESWADRSGEALQRCRPAPETGYKSDLPYKLPTIAEQVAE